jgi:hypothetical protein
MSVEQLTQQNKDLNFHAIALDQSFMNQIRENVTLRKEIARLTHHNQELNQQLYQANAELNKNKADAAPIHELTATQD